MKYLPEALLVLGTLIWGSSFVVVKDTLRDLDPAALILYRFALSAIILAAALIFRKVELFKNGVRGFALGSLLFILFITQTIGLKSITPANSAFITSLFVAFVPLISFVFFRKNPTKYQWAGILLCLIGLWLLTGGISNISPGDLLTILAAFTIAIHILLTHRYMQAGSRLLQISFQQFFWVAVLSLPLVIFQKTPMAIIKTQSIMSILYLSIFATVLAILGQTYAQRLLPPTRVAIIFTLEPVFAALFSWGLKREPWVPIQALGGLFIVLAMWVSDQKENSTPPANVLSEGFKKRE